MARIRKVEIRNFRGIRNFSWTPSPGINCLIGPGDVCKSTILEAIDYCLGARRNIQFSDTDFHQLDVENPICISVTIGELDDATKSIEGYGLYLRGFLAASGTVEDEPETGGETALTMQLTVSNDLEPLWTLVSDRAAAQGQTRNLSWGDRVRLAPSRIGTSGDYNLSWRKGSVLNRVSEERADASAALTKAGRDARTAFGEQAKEQLSETLGIVAETASELGIDVGEGVTALLDAQSVSFSGGTISVHNSDGVPLRGLGSGSTRLLIAGLQRRAAAGATMILIDEVELGLEPHRIIRLLGSLGAKERPAPLQVFMTTHSPVALRELSGLQLSVLRSVGDEHHAISVGAEDDIQGTIRLYPEAFLSESVLVCEGASEVGLMRGLDLYRIGSGLPAMAAKGVSLVDAGGVNKLYVRACALQKLGYRTAVLRDDDLKPDAAAEDAFKRAGGNVMRWWDGCALEEDLFLSLSDAGARKLLAAAIDLNGKDLVNENIKSACNNAYDLSSCDGELTDELRSVLGKAAKSKKAGWFKTVGAMETIAREIVGPDLADAHEDFREVIVSIFSWCDNAG